MILLIYALATFRLTKLLTEETGPLEIGYRIRKLCGLQRKWVAVDGRREMITIATNRVAKTLDCHWCTALYVGLFVVLAGRFAEPVMLWLAVSAVAGIVRDKL